LIKALGEAETFDDVGDISGLLEEGEKLLETNPPVRKAGEKSQAPKR